MKRFVLFAIMAGLLLFLIAGCGIDDDETPFTPETKEDGDLNDPTYQAVEGAFTESEAMADELWMWLADVVDTVFADSASLASSKLAGGQAADEVMMTYHSSSRYWYLYVSHVDTSFGQGQAVDDIVTFVLHDSIQFLHGTNPVQWPDSNLLTAVNNGVLLTITTQSGTGNVTATQRVNVTGDIVNRGDVTLNGTRSYDFGFQDQAQSCAMSIDIAGAADDVFMNIAAMDNEGCPYSGVLSHEGTIGIECTGDTTFSYSGTWWITQTFYGDHYDIVVENATTRWSTTEQCPGGVATSSIAKMLADFRERR